MTGIDAVLNNDAGYYDISLNTSGDILTADFFDTTITYSVFGERRADRDEVIPSQNRRGWIANFEEYENGSKVWLYEQERLTRTTINNLQDEVVKSLQWLVADGYAVAIDDVTVTSTREKVTLSLTVRRSSDKIERRFYELWNNTGL